MKRILSLILCFLVFIGSVPMTSIEADGAEAPVNGENDQNGDGYDDSNVYLSDLMLAVYEGYDKRGMNELMSNGFTVIDYNIYGGGCTSSINQWTMYLGYKTTTDPKNAITDIKWEEYFWRQFDRGQIPLSVSCGADGAYVASKVWYEHKSDLMDNGQFGFSESEWGELQNKYWGEEAIGYSGATTLKTIAEFALVGLAINEIISSATEVEYYASLYFGVSSKFGEPILANSLMITENRSEDGYESVCGFLNNNVKDLRWARSRVGLDEDDYTSCHLHYQRAVNHKKGEPQLDDVDYVKEISYCHNGDNDNAINEGWTIGPDLIHGRKLYDGYIEDWYFNLIYKTTRDPSEAITDFRILDIKPDNEYDEPPKMVSIAGISYFNAFSHYIIDGSLYYTRASNSGIPIAASSLNVKSTNVAMTSVDEVYARGVFSSDLGVISGWDNQTSILCYKGMHYNQASGKYIDKVYLSGKDSLVDAKNDLSAMGAEDMLTTKLDGVWLGYSTTDDEYSAITDIYIEQLGLESKNVKLIKDNFRKDFTVYYPMSIPEKRILHNGVVYACVQDCTNICSPASEAGSDYKELDTSSDNYYSYNSWVFDNWARCFMYTTKDLSAGDPITRITLEDEAIMNNGSVAVLSNNDIRRYGGKYITKNHEGQSDASYIAGIYSIAANSREEALRQLVCKGYTYFLDYDMNKGVQGNNVYIGYTKTTLVKKSIKDIMLLVGYLPDSYESNGCIYKQAEENDLNSGNSGRTAYLYYTKDSAAGQPIVELSANNMPIHYEKGYDAILNQDGGNGNCNAGIGSEEIYLMRKKADSDAKTYISSLALTNSSNGDSALHSLYAERNVKYYLNYDLNYDAGGDFVFLGYNTTTDQNDAITDIIAYHSPDPPSTLDLNGNEYYLVDDVDLNRDAGGDYIYLYYCKARTAGEPIVSLEVADRAIINNGSEIVRRYDGGSPSELNAGAGGPDIYMHYTRDIDLYQKYISNVRVASAASWQECLRRLAETGCNYYMDYDMNRDTGEDWVFVGYRRTSVRENAICGLAAYQDSGGGYTMELDGVEFTLVDDVDMSPNTGGSLVRLYQTYDGDYGDPIIDICAATKSVDNYATPLSDTLANRFGNLINTENATFDNDYENTLDAKCVWSVVSNQNGSSCDFNKDTHATDVFMYTGRIPVVYQDEYYITSLVGFDYYNGQEEAAQQILLDNGTATLFSSIPSSASTTVQIAGTISKHPENAIRDILTYTILVGDEVPEVLELNQIEYHLVGGFSSVQSGELTSETCLSTSAFTLNRYNGSVGVYLYYTTDIKAGMPISELSFAPDAASLGEDWVTADTIIEDMSDANTMQYDSYMVMYIGIATERASSRKISTDHYNFGSNNSAIYLQLKQPTPLLASIFCEPSAVGLLSLSAIIMIACITTVYIVRKKERDFGEADI